MYQPALRPDQVARYARGADYHVVLRDRLSQLLAWLQAERPGCRGRGWCGLGYRGRRCGGAE